MVDNGDKSNADSSLVEDNVVSSPGVIIKPSRVEIEEQKKWEKKLETAVAVEETDEHGNIISKRNEDLFIGGPLDGQTCAHQPNGPEASWDKGRYWADYYLKDTMIIDFLLIGGYHIYSTARSIFDGDENTKHDKAGRPMVYSGTRGASMRKCYYYCGFMEEQLLILDGVYPTDFTCQLQI